MFEPWELDNVDGQISLALPSQDIVIEEIPTEIFRKAETPDASVTEAAASKEPEGIIIERHDLPGEIFLNENQKEAVTVLARAVSVKAGPGTGKTGTLTARILHLLKERGVKPSEITAVTFTNKAAAELRQRLEKQTGGKKTVRLLNIGTFHSICLEILKENDFECIPAQEEMLLETAGEIVKEYGLPESPSGFLRRLSLEKSGMEPSGAGKDTDENTVFHKAASEYQKRLLAEGVCDFDDLLLETLKLFKSEPKKEIGRRRFHYLLVDEFQDISPQRAALLSALRAQNKHTSLFAVGDDWQAIYRFSGAQLSLTTAFHHYFGEGDRSDLDTTYRFNARIGEIANRFIQQNPHQLTKPLNSLTPGDKKAVTLLAEDQLEPLLDKLSGYAKPDERILVLARYHHLKPAALEKAATRWPKLQLEFMTIHASKGQQADYVIVVGLKEGSDGFPAPARESVMEEALLPVPEDFPDAEERRLLYVAITRARHRVWLLFNKDEPSVFVDILKSIDVPVARKP